METPLFALSTTLPPLVKIGAPLFDTILCAVTDNVLLAARATGPPNVTVLKGLTLVPIDSVALKSGSALIDRASDALPRFIVKEPVGFANVVVSKVPFVLRSRDRPLPVVPSSSNTAELAAEGRLK